jgi:lipid-A-disaccharide synthase
VKVGLVAGEASGDVLGAGLIAAIRQRAPGVQFAGVAGPKMIAAGCDAWVPAERLSVMGIAEVLKVLPELLRLRRGLVRRLRAWQPDVVVGIDSPDFNLGLERKLRASVRTVHYVSPSIWAWRPRRIRKIARAADLVLCLLPFETAPYDEAGVAARFVGHPLADEVPANSDPVPARQALGLAAARPVVAVLPGSRGTELDHLGEDFAGAVGWLAARRPQLQFVAPMARPDLRRRFADALARHAAGAAVRLVDGQAQRAIAAADVVLLASGTATLEAALIKRPMVVAYRVAPFTRWLLEFFRLLRVRRFALPNLLAGRELVPEILQDAVTPERLGSEVLRWLDDEPACAALQAEYVRIHDLLRRDASARAAEAVLELCGAGHVRVPA